MGISKSTWLALINSSAGLVMTSKKQSHLIHFLKSELNADVYLTQSSLEAIHLVKESKNINSFAVVGGDGTIAEVVNQMDLANQELLLFPCGTGNGLARDLGLISLEKSFSAARHHRKKLIDVMEVTFISNGKIHKRRFISTASFGYVTETVLFAKQMHRSLGAFRYLLALLVKSFSSQPFEFEIRVDDNHFLEKKALTIVINNTRHAGNISIFNNAKIDDQKMDIVLASGSTWNQINIKFAAEELLIKPSFPMKFMLDGDIWEQVTEVQFNFLPKKLICYAENIQ